jgi:fatty-acyl-CoA synthase
VYPAEVEGVLFDHPAVAEVAVIGTPDPKWGERVCAIVVIQPGSTVDLEELREFAGRHIGRYKLPLQLEIVDALPRNPTGKVLRTELRKRYA